MVHHAHHIYPTLFPHCLRSVPRPISFLGQKITPASLPTATTAHSHTTKKLLPPQLTPFLRCQERSQAVPLSALNAINVQSLQRCTESFFPHFNLCIFVPFCCYADGSAHLIHIDAVSASTARDQSASSSWCNQY